MDDCNSKVRRAVFLRNIRLESPILTNTHNLAIQFQRSGWSTTWIPKPKVPSRLADSGRAISSKFGVTQVELSVLFNYGGRSFNSYKWIWDLFPFSVLCSRRFIQKSGLLRPDIFFAGSLESASLYKMLKPKHIVYNAHDAFALYPNVRKSIKAIEADLVRRSTLVVTTSQMTRESLMSMYGVSSEKVLNIGHGVDNEKYNQVSEPVELRSIPRPRAVCLGTLDMQDVGLISHAVKRLQSVSFVFIGPGGDRLRGALAGQSNCHFLGPIEQTLLPNYLSFCDVGLIGYDVKLKDSRLYGSNPMKRYDYAAAGLQTVSVELLEYRKTPSPMYVASSPIEFAECIRASIQSPAFSRSLLREFAAANDWKSKYTSVLTRLGCLSQSDLLN